MDDLAKKRVEMGQRIERARADRGLSIERARAELAAALTPPAGAAADGPAISRFQWMRWEKGSPLPAEMVLPLARVLDIDPLWLLGAHARTLRAPRPARVTA